MKSISVEKIAFVAIRARELDAKVGRWDTQGDVADSDSILESRRGDATERELREFITGLNEDEQAELVAVAWIGRGTFEPEELTEAVETATYEASAPTADYLLGMPLLADFLDDGMEKLGIDPLDAEEGVQNSV